MSFVTPETIQAIAHSINIPKLSQEAAKALGPDVEFRLRELIQVHCNYVDSSGGYVFDRKPSMVQDAQKFARHSRRSSVTTTDVNNALRMRNAEVGSWCLGWDDLSAHLADAGMNLFFTAFSPFTGLQTRTQPST